MIVVNDASTHWAPLPTVYCLRVVNGPKKLSPTRRKRGFSSANPTQTRTLTYQPVWARFKLEIKNITLNFEKILIKKSFTLPQSFQLRTAIILYRQENGISILLRRSARLKLDNFSKSKPEPGSNPTRKTRARLTTQYCLWTVSPKNEMNFTH